MWNQATSLAFLQATSLAFLSYTSLSQVELPRMKRQPRFQPTLFFMYQNSSRSHQITFTITGGLLSWQYKLCSAKFYYDNSCIDILSFHLNARLHMMSRSAITRLARQISQLTVNRNFFLTCGYSTDVRHSIPNRSDAEPIGSFSDQFSNQSLSSLTQKHIRGERRPQVGESVSRKDKISFLVNTLLDLKDSKEAVYGALDAWVAWEQNFPIGSLKQVLLKLEKEQQWHRMVQVIKWMLSKGQGNTMGTYEQLIKALDMDHRAKEAHEFWNKKIGSDLHSVPWRLCSLMISVYYHNHMFQDLIKLFKGLEAFDRKPPEKSIVQKVADTYELLDLLDEKDRLLEKYKDMFTETWAGSPKRLRGPGSQRKEKQVEEN